MNATEPYSWTILRVVPRIERGERINVGAVVFCRGRKYLGLQLAVDDARLQALWPSIDLPSLHAQLHGLARVADGDPSAGRVAGMDPPDRFGFLAAPSNTIVQASPVHVGLCDDPAATLTRLVDRYVRIP